MIRFQGVETVCGHPRDAVFAAGMVKANWPTAAGVRLGPDAEKLVDGGRVTATLDLPGLVLAVTGKVTRFEPGSRVEASGHQAGIWAATTVWMDDNTESVDRSGPDADLRTSVTWLFEARLPFWLSVFEFPATVAIKVAIPVLRERFIANILRYLDESGARFDTRHALVDQSQEG
ncbi:hypothetical protein ABIB25_005003 [Nakamurella sp. UYEF19]|uniref:hypothetical protein n=1 Tax=Nakamurella sp. UYEF19 TaxID=1756392 RepID=UPI0033917332